MTTPMPLDVVTRLARLDVCCLSDAMEALGLPSGVVDGLQPVWEGAKLTGRAVTTRLALGPPPPGTPPVHLGARAIEAADVGDVIVIDNGGREAMGSWGGLLSSAAALRDVAGVVTDGCCRDVDEARALGFAVFARAGAVRTARGRVHEESSGTPVSLSGVTVNPGDVVAADGSGVVVIPADHAEAVAVRAERIAHREAGMLASLRAGTPVSEVLGASYEHLLRS
jgi:4-hydroxy-4-methyl-2-oxoglutarate aldolase